MTRISNTPSGFQRDGRFLHSQRDPLREAGIWASEKPQKLCGVVFVLGLGGAFHVTEFSRQHPELTIIACEFDQELIDFSGLTVTRFSEVIELSPGTFALKLAEDLSWWDDFEDARESLLRNGYSVLRFRPAWIGREKEMTWVEDCLLDRSLEAVSKSLGITGDDQGFDLNIKTLTQNTLLLEDEMERKLLLALRELVA